jgi:branched-chain amino acid transport system substrate-binding protein
MTKLTRRTATGLLGLAALMPGRAFAAEPIKLGVALSQTGNLADSAEHYKRAIELWRDQVNARGGLLGRPVEIVLYDDRSDPATAARLYERLITNDKADLLISPWGSASTATASAVAEKHKRVFINAGGASESIQSRGFKHVFQSAAAIPAYVEGIGPIAKKHDLKTIAFISRDYGAARDMKKSLDKIAAENGLQMVISEFFPAGTVDYSSNIARARQANPDMWISIGYPNEAIEMVRQFRSVNYMPKFFIHNGASQPDFLKAVGKDGDYAFAMSLYEPVLKTKGNDVFVKEFKAKFGYEPGYYCGFAYAGATVLEQAVAKTGSLDQEKLRETLSSFETDTVMGRHKVDPKTGGQIGVKGLVIQIRGGENTIVYPEDLKTGDAVVPIPAWDKR